MAQIDFLDGKVFQAVDSNGVPLSGGLVWCYDAGSDNFRNMYPTIQDALNGTNPLGHVVTLNSAGRAHIVYAGPSKFVLEDANIDPDTGHGNVIDTWDDVGRFGNTVIDPNGNIIAEFDYQSNARNYVSIENAPSGSPPVISFTGSDTNINGVLSFKGGGKPVIVTGSGTYVLPGADGITGSVLTSDGAGNWSMQPPAGISSVIAAGFVMPFAGSSAPTGWLGCDGSAVSRATYSSLFAAIGTTWGSGDGVNTFNLPNLNRRAVIGSGGTGTGTIGNAVGNTGGEETHTLITGEIPSHTHGYNFPGIFTLSPSLGGSPFNLYSPNSTSSALNTGSTGGGGAHNNMQPSAVMLMCIKT